MDKLNKLLRGWSGRRESEQAYIDSLSAKIIRSVDGMNPGGDAKLEPSAPLRVKLGYALSGAMVTAAVFLVFMDSRQPEEMEITVAREAEAPRELTLRSIAEPARRRAEFAEEAPAPDIFPRLGHLHDRGEVSLEVIAGHLADSGWGPLGKDKVRLVRQPFGVSARGYEVNLQTSEVIVYPGAHDDGEPWNFMLSEEGKGKFLNLVEEGDFFTLTQRNRRVVRDGAWYFIEADMSGRYHWILHRGKDDEAMLEIFSIVENEAEIEKQRLRRDE